MTETTAVGIAKMCVTSDAGANLAEPCQPPCLS